MKPWDTVYFSSNLSMDLSGVTEAAEKHWQVAFDRIKPISRENKEFSLRDIIKAFRTYKFKVHATFIGIFALVEMIGIIKPLKVKIVDLNKVVRFSYLKKTKLLSSNNDWDIAVYASDLMFSITRDFGFDCTHVNGRFRTSNHDSNKKFMYFYGPQNMLKSGFGYKRPIATLKEFLRLTKR